MMPDGPHCEDDFYAWTRYQTEVLRSMPVSENRFDREHENLPAVCPSSLDEICREEICREDWNPVGPAEPQDRRVHRLT